MVAPLWWKVFEEPLPVLWLNFRQMEAALRLQVNVWPHLVFRVTHLIRVGGLNIG